MTDPDQCIMRLVTSRCCAKNRFVFRLVRDAALFFEKFEVTCTDTNPEYYALLTRRVLLATAAPRLWPSGEVALFYASWPVRCPLGGCVVGTS